MGGGVQVKASEFRISQVTFDVLKNFQAAQSVCDLRRAVELPKPFWVTDSLSAFDVLGNTGMTRLGLDSAFDVSKTLGLTEPFRVTSSLSAFDVLGSTGITRRGLDSAFDVSR